jgi:hypothetical protein
MEDGEGRGTFYTEPWVSSSPFIELSISFHGLSS